MGTRANAAKERSPVSHPLLPPFFSVSGEGDVFFIPFNGIPEDGRGRFRSPEPSEGV